MFRQVIKSKIQRSDIKAIGYPITFTLLNYTFSLTSFDLLNLNSLTLRLALAILGLVLMYIVARIFYGNPFKIPRSPYFDSLLHVLALMSIGEILAIAIAASKGINLHEMYLKAKPGFVNVWVVYLPVYALIFWGIAGIIVAYFYHSVTIELFGRRSVGIMVATALFALNYNAPLITNYWNLWDIVFFGFVFAYSYSVKRNPLALLFAYLLFEVPLWWCILAPLGEWALVVYYAVRFVISVIALVIFVRRVSHG